MKLKVQPDSVDTLGWWRNAVEWLTLAKTIGFKISRIHALSASSETP